MLCRKARILPDVRLYYPQLVDNFHRASEMLSTFVHRSQVAFGWSAAFDAEAAQMTARIQLSVIQQYKGTVRAEVGDPLHESAEQRMARGIFVSQNVANGATKKVVESLLHSSQFIPRA